VASEKEDKHGQAIEMSGGIPEIGRCIGCDRPSRLHDGVCEACLTQRGRSWAVTSHRCRTEPKFALAIYGRLKTDRGRELFLRAYRASVLRGNCERASNDV
jgi:hypothetical protein